jgi:peptidase E
LPGFFSKDALLMEKHLNVVMPKLYLLGGESVYHRSAKEVNEQAFKDAGSNPSVSVFPWARPSFDKKYRRRQLLMNYLQSLGAGKVDFIEYYEIKEAVAEKLEHTALVYLTGGQPSILIERLKTSGVDEILKIFQGVVVGRSAGALALCRRCIATCRSNGKVRIVEGLGLVGITLKVHYIPENDEILKRFSLKEKIFAVPEGAALVYDHGKLSAIGKVYIFADGVRQVFGETFYEKTPRT